MLSTLACRYRLVLFGALVLAAAGTRATQTDNRGIRAVPTPGPVAIDGRLDDWDLSGSVLQCYDLESLRDIYSAQIAVMYDADHLYLALRWQDPTPMGNSHHPRFQSGKGWAGDCVQLRLKTDRITHVTAWYHAASGEPTINLGYGKSLTEPFGGGDLQLYRSEGWKLDQGAEMAFLRNADGKGYVQEIKLPWKLITLEKRYTAGESLRCGIELLWGEADWPVHRYADNLDESANNREFFWTAHNAWGLITLEPKGNLKLPEPAWLKAARGEELQGPVELAYDLPKAARVTLAIDDVQGQRVRNLIAALPRPAGRNVERWDGLDDTGKPVPPGSYRFKGLFHDGIRVTYVMAYANPGNPTWGTPDGRGAFYSDHAAPAAAAAAGDFVALGCPMGEAGQHLIGCDLKGQRLWGLADRAFGQNRHIALATDGTTLWVANEWSRAFVYRVRIATGEYQAWEATERDADGREHPVLELAFAEPGGDKGINLRALAWRDGVLAAALAVDGQVVLLDASTGAVKARLAVEQPRALAFLPDGRLVVLAGERLVRLGADGAVTPFAEGTWPAGAGLAADAAGNVCLSVREPDHNVKVFGPDGKLLRDIGRRGGRPAHGPFDDLALRNPGQPALDAQGRLWVPEGTQNPKRTSVWTLDGTFVRDFIGTTSYAGAGAINPDDPTMALADSTVYRIDLAQGSWRPVYSLGSRGDPNDIFPCYADSHLRFLTRDGHTYVWGTDTARGANEVHVMLFDGKAWRSVAHTGTLPDARQPKVEQWKKYTHPFFAGHEGQSYVWCDRSGDGLVQAEELTFGQLPVRSYYWGQLPQTDGTLVFPGADGQSVVKLPVAEWLPNGAPFYDLGAAQVVKFAPPLRPGNSGEGMIMGGGNGRVYLNRDPLTAVGPDGAILGTYPSRHVSVHGSHTAGAARPGYLIGPSSILGTADLGGEAGEVFDLNGNLGENYLFTADALWIQALFKDTRGWFETPTQAVRGMPMDAISAGGESFGGYFCRTRDGKVWLVIGGTDARVLELSGLDSIRRFAGTFAYSPEQYAAAQSLAQERAAAAALPKAATIPRAATPPTIDGKPDDWPELTDDAKPAILIQESAQRRYARVAARYDDTNLYLAWRVFGPARLRNAGQDDRLLFKTGDCVDLMLGPDPAPADGTGQLRLLLSSLAGKPVAVLYRRKVAGTPEAERAAFSSPWRTIHFDRVAQLPEVVIATAALPGGCLVETAVPWALLGVKPAAGLKLRGDFGVLLADSGGTVTTARHYWANKATGLVNDIPGEADLTPQLWGALELE